MEKPGMFSCYRHAIMAIGSVVAAWAVLLGFIWAVVHVAGRWPNQTFAGVFAIGIICLSSIAFRESRGTGRFDRVWSGALLLLAVALAVRSIVGVL